jgi:serine/threonine-protein kinase
MDQLPIQPGNVIGKRYRVDRLLGVGPMSVVVAATHLGIERAVAIKFLNPDGVRSRDAAERFRREAQTAARIRNEHVVRVLDVGTLENGVPYMVMDLVDGRSLKAELAERGPLSVSEATAYVLEAIEGLAAAHAAGVVHRDLKPANLFLAERVDHSRLVKVLDFGVSKSLAESSGDLCSGLTRTGMVVGSPLYMPPEQLESSRTVDHRADIWALGVVLYELVTGHVPFDTSSLAELCSMLERSEPAPIARYRSDISREFEAVIARCLKRDRSARYRDVSELAEALAPFAPPSATIHVERARRLLDPNGSRPSADLSTAFAGTHHAYEERSRPRRPFARVRTWLVLSLAFGAAIGVAFAIRDADRAVQRPRAAAAQTPRTELPSRPEPRVEPLEPATREPEGSRVSGSVALANAPSPVTLASAPSPVTLASAPAVTARAIPRVPAAVVLPPPARSAEAVAYRLPDFGGRQ